MNVSTYSGVLISSLSPSDSCPQEYRGQRGRIQSPGYPAYRNNTHCEIVVRVENRPFKEWRIFLEVEEFDLEQSHDFLLIDGKPMELYRNDNYTGEF